jgi:hypothetical protein
MDFGEILDRNRRIAAKMREEEEDRRKREEEERKKGVSRSKINKEKELNAWRVQHPSGIVSMRITGDPSFASNFMGEGKSLLYSVINAMKFNNLGQHQDERRYPDGTIVRAKSVFGQNTIEIDVSKSTAVAGVAGTCTITFIDFPLSVPPMKNPAVIEPADVSGVDYFKTYYSFDVSKCPTCQDIAWDFLFTYATPFEARHYFNPVTNLDEPNNHTVYSLFPPAWAQVIDRGQDEGGNYIIWKAYTETGNISRTGLGIMLLKASIMGGGQIICDQQQKIDVDCCLKDPILRPVEIWWEDFGTCQPFIYYGSKAICKMPTEVPMGGTAGLIWYGCTYPQQPLYAIPEILGSCLPVEWTLSGPIALWNSDKNDNVIYFKCLEDVGACNAEATITLRDRCGTEYIVRGTPCCEDAKELSILYTSLLMSCGGQQTFTPDGGCGPYKFSVTSGGGTIDEDTGVYTAPATNVNCTDNPTITVTDCCGITASVSLAVNCYGPAGALGIVQFEECSGCWCSPLGCNNGAYGCFDFINSIYDCTGALLSVCETRPCANCTPPPGYVQHACGDCSSTGCPPSSCYTNQCGCIKTTNCPCGVLVDGRSDAMKAAGCCPLNPFTGLPYYFS